TTAGSGVSGFDAFFTYADKMSPLGNASADDCANFCGTMFSDYTKIITMQNLFHEGGFSNTGVSQGIVEEMQKAALAAENSYTTWPLCLQRYRNIDLNDGFETHELEKLDRHIAGFCFQ